MTDDRASHKKQQELGNAGKEKKLYQKPAFRYERVFEVQALSCGKVFSGINRCKFSKKVS
jgi:hypothetical protein